MAFTLIKVFEGRGRQVYLDPGGVPTVGFGHKLLPGEEAIYGGGRELPLKDAEDLLISDYGKHRAGVLARTSGLELEEHELEALTSFCFNFGEGALGTSTLLKRVLARDRRAAAFEFTRWRYAKDKKTGELKPWPWLIRRRHIEACWFLGASQPTLLFMLGDEAA